MENSRLRCFQGSSRRINKRTLRAITLIEVLVVFVVLAMIMGVVGVNVVKMIKQERFRAGVGRLTEKLQMAQDLMLVFDTDVAVILKSEDDGLQCTLKVEQPLSAKLAKIALEPELIRGVSNICFQDHLQGIEICDEVILRFFSGGSKMSRGLLYCSFQRSQREKVIALHGYPHTIGGPDLDVFKNEERGDAFYPKEILEEETSVSTS